MKRGIDDACFDLAKHFLADVKEATAEDIAELAEDIQCLCENRCSAIEGDAS